MFVAILISVGFLLACGLVLAGLLLIAERKILNYGTCRVDINEGGKVLEVDGGASLLSTLAEQDIYLPSACGGRGTCAYCKVRVTSGGGMVGPVEAPYLSPEELADHVRLACQVKVRRDLGIRIPEELFSARRFQARVAHKRALTHDIVDLRLALLDPPTIDFTAGQYVQLESAPYKGHDPVMRAYSVASPPSARDHVDLIVRYVPGGICTTWVFEHLQEGDQVTLAGPFGHFQLNDSDAPILCIAGGSGMAPIWSILRDMREKGTDRRPTTYFFGALTQQDLFLHDELRQMETELPWFTYVPALSREPQDSDWRGDRGIITDVVSRHIPDASGHEAYLCGSPGMIDAAVATLVDNGMPEDKIFYDKFA